MRPKKPVLENTVKLFIHVQSWTLNQWTFYNFSGISQAKSEEAFIYIIHKPRLRILDHMAIRLKQVRVSIPTQS